MESGAAKTHSRTKKKRCRHKKQTQTNKVEAFTPVNTTFTKINARIETKSKHDIKAKNDYINMAIVSEWGADLNAERAEMVIEKLGDIFEDWIIDKGKDSDIKFEGGPLYFMEESAIRILCSNENTVEWLKKTFASMDPLWENAKLFTRNWNEVSFVKCGLTIPKIDSDVGKLCNVLMKCNPEYKIDQWRLLKYVYRENKCVLMMGIPQVIFQSEVIPRRYKIKHVLKTFSLKCFNREETMYTDCPSDEQKTQLLQT